MNAIDSIDRETLARTMAEIFCATPLPASVCPDPCASDPSYPHPRSGTNLLTVAEAQEMFRSILASVMP
jgi:hypothetical protein